MTSASSSLPFAEELSDFEDENSLTKSAFIDVFETNKQVRKIVPALTRLLAEQGKLHPSHWELRRSASSFLSDGGGSRHMIREVPEI